jgi:hypothetical protein
MLNKLYLHYVGKHEVVKIFLGVFSLCFTVYEIYLMCPFIRLHMPQQDTCTTGSIKTSVLGHVTHIGNNMHCPKCIKGEKGKVFLVLNLVSTTPWGSELGWFCWYSDWLLTVQLRDWSSSPGRGKNFLFSMFWRPPSLLSSGYRRIFPRG